MANSPTSRPTSRTTVTSTSGGFALLIDVWGADHHGYVPRVKAAMQALGYDPTELEVVITQLVKLMRAGEEVQASPNAPATSSSCAT